MTVAHGESFTVYWAREIRERQATALAVAEGAPRRQLDQRVRTAVAEAEHVARRWGSGYWTGRPGSAA